MEERNAKVYSDEQLASELKNKRAAGGGAKALSIAGIILVFAGLSDYFGSLWRFSG